MEELIIDLQGPTYLMIIFQKPSLHETPSHQEKLTEALIALS